MSWLTAELSPAHDSVRRGYRLDLDAASPTADRCWADSGSVASGIFWLHFSYSGREWRSVVQLRVCQRYSLAEPPAWRWVLSSCLSWNTAIRLKNTENVQVSTLPGLRADVQLHYWGGNKQDSPQSSSQFLLMTTLLKPPNPLNVCVYTDEMTSVGVAVAMVIWTDWDRRSEPFDWDWLWRFPW